MWFWFVLECLSIYACVYVFVCVYIYIYICVCVCVLWLIKLWYQAIGLICRVFANGPGYQGSIPGRVIPKTQKIVLDATLLNTQHYKVMIKGKVEQSWEWSSALPYTSV